MSQKRGREPLPRKGSDQQPPSLPQSAHLCQRPHQNLHLQYQWETVLHGLAQVKCQEIFLMIEIGWSLKIIYPAKTKRRMWQVSLAQNPPIKENEPKINEQSSEKCRWGSDCPFCKSQKEGREEDKTQQELKASPQPKLQRPQARWPRTRNLNKTRAKQQWEEEMERLNEKYNLDCFTSSELDSESDKREQYCYEHGYETLI